VAYAQKLIKWGTALDRGWSLMSVG